MVSKFLSRLFGRGESLQGLPNVPLDDALGAQAMMLNCARIFVGEEPSDYQPPMPHLLARERLDYSSGSVAALDAYLLALHDAAPELLDDSEACEQIILGAGGYLGEVLRRGLPDANLNWLSYRNLCKLFGEDAMLKAAGEELLLNQYVIGAGRMMFFPLKGVFGRLRKGSAWSSLEMEVSDTREAVGGKVLENWLSFERIGLST